MASVTYHGFVIKVVDGPLQGTTAGFAAYQKDGIGLSAAGRLCNFVSGKLKRFDTLSDAETFLSTWKHNEKYGCEIVEISGTEFVRAAKKV